MEIEICPVCKGFEKTKKCDYDGHSYVKCYRCNGTGRVKVNTFKYSVAYDTDNKLIFDIENQIITLLRNLEKK